MLQSLGVTSDWYRVRFAYPDADQVSEIMPNLPIPDWPRWFSWKISAADFEQRREPYVLYKNYPERFDDFMGRMHMITTDLPREVARMAAANAPPPDPMIARSYLVCIPIPPRTVGKRS